MDKGGFPDSAKGLDRNLMERAVVGKRYEAMVPDTLDLAERMDLAVNALTNVWQSEAKWGLKFIVDFSRKPPVLFMNHLTDAYLNIPPKFVEALALCRHGSGNRQNLDVDFAVLRAQLSLIGEDGLTYCPTDISDKALRNLPDFKENRNSKIMPFAEIWGEGRQLIALATLAQIDDDARWSEIGKQKIDRLLSLTREKEGFRFFWRARYQPGQNPPPGADEPGVKSEAGGLPGKDPLLAVAYSIGAVGHGAGLFYRAVGYEPALELSRGLAHWALARLFKNEDGSYNFYHFHHGLYALMAVCEYAYAAQDRKVLERVDACYRFVRQMGDPLIGFFPEMQPGSDWYLKREGNTVEICEVADMVWLALYLTRAGLGDYWDDVDRWVRNVYAEGQLLDPTLFDSIPDSFYNKTTEQRAYQDTDNIYERSIGSFFGWMRANEGLWVYKTPGGPKLKDQSIMHCCTANGARTFYCVWESIVTKTDDLVKVNLLLNRASPWLDVDSFLPAEGKVVLHIKDASKVAVRVPEWCDPNQVRVQVGKDMVKTMVEGRYLHLYSLKPGDEVTFSFSVPTRVVHRVLGEIPYKLTLKGSNVINIDPKGVAYPLYQNQPTGKLIKKTRFIPRGPELTW